MLGLGLKQSIILAGGKQNNVIVTTTYVWGSVCFKIKIHVVHIFPVGIY